MARDDAGNNNKADRQRQLCKIRSDELADELAWNTVPPRALHGAI